MKKALPIAAAAICALLVLSFVVMLAGSIRMQNAPKPTEYENSEWISEDGLFRLYVHEFDKETLQCRAELVYTNGEGSYTYIVSDAPYGVIGVYISESDIDEWLRVKCDDSGFTVRINRTTSLHYSDSYGKNAELSFTRVR